MAEARQRARTAVALRDPLHWRDFLELARTAEDAGYEAVFLPEIAGRESFSALAALSQRTERLLLAPGVAPIHARRPETLAMAAATAQELSGGRFILGLGAGPPAPGALDRVREAVASLRAAFAGRPTPEGFTLALDAGSPPPIWLAALGDRMISLAGEIADGVLLNWCTPERVRRACELIRDGAGRAGREPSAVTVAVYVRACLNHEDADALAVLREATGQYASMPHYRRQMEAMGLGEAAARAADATAAGRAQGVPEELVRELCLFGEPAAAKRRLDEYRAAGADLPVVYPVPALEPVSSIMGTILALAPDPAIQP